ncbi:MAG: hypothetical protein CMH53_09235 [Myxococcales bacterium]|nr:hypothetical protein [Myxococcales bacterium]
MKPVLPSSALSSVAPMLGRSTGLVALCLCLMSCTAAVTIESTSPSVPTASDGARHVALHFVESIMTAKDQRWRALVALPVAWNDRCGWLDDIQALSSVIMAQQPPPGSVEVRRTSTVDPSAGLPRAAALADLRMNCGSARLDSALNRLRGLPQKIVLLQLKTPSGAHALYIRVTRFANGWKVTGLSG